jgi:hypothetical protein
VLPHDLPATPNAQANWRFCQKCNTMFYDGYPDKGTCPADGGHSAQGFNFNLPIQQEPDGTASVSPSIATAPFGKYVDLFTECTYDVNYNVTNRANGHGRFIDGRTAEIGKDHVGGYRSPCGGWNAISTRIQG